MAAWRTGNLTRGDLEGDELIEGVSETLD
uniref:Uncharacterized protein n=1 Tax=Leersia perrieri TaxID=77586 RepID=A0A0D9WWT8_9ORYZ